MSINLFAYLIHPQLHEIVMGHTETMIQRFSSTAAFHYCSSEAELYQATKPYRDQEWILTSLSDLPSLFPPVISSSRLSCS